MHTLPHNLTTVIQKAPSRPAPPASVVKVKSRSVSPVSEFPVDAAASHKAPWEKGSSILDVGVTQSKPNDRLIAGDLRSPETEGLVESRTTPVQPVAHSSGILLLDDLRARIDFDYVSQALSPSPSQPLEHTRPDPPSQSLEHSTPFGSTSHAQTRSTFVDTNPQMLDLRGLSISRTPGPSRPLSRFSNRATTSRAPSPYPPVPLIISGDDEMEDLYGPPLGLPSPHPPPPPRPPLRRQSPSPQSTVRPEPLVLPVLAARDPRLLAMLERQERREVARPRQGARKAQAVRGAGKKRGGFVLIANRTEGCAEQIPR
ncbi:hypothetical protein F5148DRAFT_1284070 [Russula earlei]|uniref:Uncharacterized protein n=1 Tax=Russula earlei TaxID=71964 RepID=A0ACC0UBD8_9AGAM|nr:hypothetical protein F5148DRAFT_1284070 [Russula earlei]